MTQPRRDGPDARGPWETDGQPGTIRVAYGQHRSPKRARPSESTSSVAISAAKASGSHAPALSTEGANRYRIVTWAVAASATNGDGVLPGWSAIAKASKPSSSAFLASASHASRPVGCPCKANEIFTNQDSHRFNSDRHGPPDSLRSSSTPATRPRPSATHSLRTESPTFAPHGDKPTINDAFALSLRRDRLPPGAMRHMTAPPRFGEKRTPKVFSHWMLALRPANSLISVSASHWSSTPDPFR